MPCPVVTDRHSTDQRYRLHPFGQGGSGTTALPKMDYPNLRRIKVWGRAEVVQDDPELLKQVTDPNYRGRPERAIRFHVEAWDVNCPQHITPRFTEEEVQSGVQALRHRLAELEAENVALRSQIRVTEEPTV